MVRIDKEIMSMNFHSSFSSSGSHFIMAGAVLVCKLHIGHRTVLLRKSLFSLVWRYNNLFQLPPSSVFLQTRWNYGWARLCLFIWYTFWLKKKSIHCSLNVIGLLFPSDPGVSHHMGIWSNSEHSAGTQPGILYVAYWHAVYLTE